MRDAGFGEEDQEFSFRHIVEFEMLTRCPDESVGQVWSSGVRLNRRLISRRHQLITVDYFRPKTRQNHQGRKEDQGFKPEGRGR